MKTKSKLIIEVFGWYGTVAIIVAYALTSYGVVTPTSLFYQALNLTGAIGVIFVAWYKKVYQSVAINTFWAIIASVAIIRLFV